MRILMGFFSSSFVLIRGSDITTTIDCNMPQSLSIKLTKYIDSTSG